MPFEILSHFRCDNHSHCNTCWPWLRQMSKKLERLTTHLLWTTDRMEERSCPTPDPIFWTNVPALPFLPKRFQVLWSIYWIPLHKRVGFLLRSGAHTQTADVWEPWGLSQSSNDRHWMKRQCEGLRWRIGLRSLGQHPSSKGSAPKHSEQQEDPRRNENRRKKNIAPSDQVMFKFFMCLSLLFDEGEVSSQRFSSGE